MKKNLLIAFALLLAQFSNAQTAINFDCEDCAANSHNLFDELDAGKVIVLTWVMPCSSCIPVALTAANKVLEFATTNPGVVKFYLVDDYADTPCNTLSSWANTNGITTDAVFSNAVISMADYGGPGGSMQKTIILAGPNHSVVYNRNGSLSASTLQMKIEEAIALTTGIEDNNKKITGLKLYPNPAQTNAVVSYSLPSANDVRIEIINMLGEKVNTVSFANQTAGNHEYKINLVNLSAGDYFVTLLAGEATETMKLTIMW